MKTHFGNVKSVAIWGKKHMFRLKKIWESSMFTASFLRKIDTGAKAADGKSYEAHPQTEPVDYKTLRENLYSRFSKSFDKLAQ